jgi:inner membrane transporter RhtA
MSLQPAAAALSGWLILDQVLGVTELTALVMVVCASAGITLTTRTPAIAQDVP